MDSVTRWQHLRKQWLASDQLSDECCGGAHSCDGRGSSVAPPATAAAAAAAAALPSLSTSLLQAPGKGALQTHDAATVADVLGRCWKQGLTAQEMERDAASDLFAAALLPPSAAAAAAGSVPGKRQHHPQLSHYADQGTADDTGGWDVDTCWVPTAPTGRNSSHLETPAAVRSSSSSPSWRQQVQRQTDARLTALQPAERRSMNKQQGDEWRYIPSSVPGQRRHPTAADVSSDIETQLCLARIEATPLHKTGAHALIAAALAAKRAEEARAAAAVAARLKAEAQREKKASQLAAQLYNFHRARAAGRMLQEWRLLAATAKEHQAALIAAFNISKSRSILKAWHSLAPPPDAAALEAAATRWRIAAQFHRLYRLHACMGIWRAQAARQAAAARQAKEQEEAAERLRLHQAQEEQRRELVADRFHRLYRLFSCFVTWRHSVAVAAAVRKLHPAAGTGQCTSAVPLLTQQQQDQAATRQPPQQPKPAAPAAQTTEAKLRLMRSAAQRQKVKFAEPPAQDPVAADMPVVSRALPPRPAAAPRAHLPQGSAGLIPRPHQALQASSAGSEEAHAVSGQPEVWQADRCVLMEQGADSSILQTAEPPQQQQPEAVNGNQDRCCEITEPEAQAESVTRSTSSVAPPAHGDEPAAPNTQPLPQVMQPPPPKDANRGRLQQLEQQRLDREAQQRLQVLRAQLAASQLALARAHSERSLLLRLGMGPWHVLMERQQQLMERAVGWRKRRVMRSALDGWKDALFHRWVGGCRVG